MQLAAGIAVIAAPPLRAQEKMEVVQVTGTRITAPGTTSNSPISSIGAEEIKAAQPIAVEEFFKSLPAAVPAIGPGTNNGTGGAATIDLRGLGPNRTLVLVNGRRLVPFNLSGAVDTNAIPLALISRVDLITGGASAVYGADAVSGVVNFNLKRSFTGIELATSYGATADQRDARRRRADLTIGANLPDHRGNVVLNVGKTIADPLTQGARSYGITSLNSLTGGPTGSPTTVPSAFSTSKGAGGTDALPGTWQIDPASGALVQPVQLYNGNPPNYYVTGFDRKQATSLGNFKFNEHAEAYAELFHTDSKVGATIAEAGTFSSTFNVPIGNPFIPAAARQQLCARRGIPAASCVEGNPTIVPLMINRRFVELGPRAFDFDTRTQQYTVGLKGEIAADWTYDLYWSRGNADQDGMRRNWGSQSRVVQALNALTTTTCVNPANGCVPLNVFGAAGSITPAQLGFINLSTHMLQSLRQDVGALSVSGDLGQRMASPLAAQPVTMALSLEQRKVRAYTQSDAALQTGDVLGNAAMAPDRAGAFELREYALETLVPLVSDKPFIKALNLELGYRQTRFSTDARSLDYGSWKYGGEWAPVRSLRLRGMVQKATRSPNINELFAPVVPGLSNLAVDPCQGNRINQAESNVAGTLSNLCRLTGVPQGEIGVLPAPTTGQISIQSGGDPALGPEEAKTRTIGFVWEPLPKFALTADYYKIDIDKAISSPSTTDIIDGCYSTAFNPGLTPNAACALLGRNTITGTFNGVEAKGVQTALSNLGRQNISGVDVNVAYRLSAGAFGIDARYGSIDISGGFNQIQRFRFRPTPAAIEHDCLGYYSVACGGPTYRRKFNQRTTWTVGAFSLGYNWRYVSAVSEEPGGTDFLPAFAKIAPYHYVDVSAGWNVTKMIRLNISVNNIANKQPPIVGGTIGTTTTNSGNTFPQYYDAVGRYVTFGAALKF
ncbi:TonB-dependent receptor [Massilia sp. R2A-15]|uniref:TonB-dependent receptor domain-containing protein n=1 Tax=Massilia sp. R2A-15 TaxID=3064278 RepID=UPI0027355E5E|nr:TonB-dependent receptor [Massilia sp. R2A-15]WLI90067.1 TonB-dependent receptor [Massilia sp. R2A-15]